MTDLEKVQRFLTRVGIAYTLRQHMTVTELVIDNTGVGVDSRVVGAGQENITLDFHKDGSLDTIGIHTN